MSESAVLARRIRKSLTPFSSPPQKRRRSFDAARMFEANIASFLPQLWFGRACTTPRGVSPIEAARRGWSLRDKNTLICTRCSRTIDIDKMLRSAQRTTDKYLLDTHDSLCIWAMEPLSPESIYPPLTSNLRAYVQSQMERFQTLTDSSTLATFCRGNGEEMRPDLFLICKGWTACDSTSIHCRLCGESSELNSARVPRHRVWCFWSRAVSTGSEDEQAVESPEEVVRRCVRQMTALRPSSTTDIYTALYLSISPALRRSRSSSKLSVSES